MVGRRRDDVRRRRLIGALLVLLVPTLLGTPSAPCAAAAPETRIEAPTPAPLDPGEVEGTAVDLGGFGLAVLLPPAASIDDVVWVTLDRRRPGYRRPLLRPPGRAPRTI